MESTQNGDDSLFSGYTSAKQRARRLRKNATEMAKTVQALLQLAEEIENEADCFEAKRRRKDAASGKEIAKDIFKAQPASESAEKSDDSVFCKHQ